MRNEFEVEGLLQNISRSPANFNASVEADGTDLVNLPLVVSHWLKDLSCYSHSKARLPDSQKPSATLDALMPTQSMSQFSALCECCKSILDLNHLLGECAPSSIQMSIGQREMDADIPIRAVLHGWSAVGCIYILDCVCTIMGVANESIWRHWGIFELVAVLKVVSQCFVYVKPQVI